MKQILAFLPYVAANSYELAVAKGLHYLPNNLSEMHSRNIATSTWQKRQLKT